MASLHADVWHCVGIVHIVLYTDKVVMSLHSAVSQRIVPVIRKQQRKTFSSAGNRDAISRVVSGGLGVGVAGIVCVSVCLYTVYVMDGIDEW